MKTGNCLICGTPFIGGNRRKFCSLRCKRRLESKRRSWDHLTRVVKHLHIAAGRGDIQTARREEYLRRAETLAAILGERP